VELEPILFDKMGFDSKTMEGDCALVTGGAKGIGRQTALALALLGARVAIVDRDPEEAEETADRIRRLGGEVLVVHADIAADGQLVGAIEEVCSQWHGVDILVNNAAEAFVGSFAQETQEVWDRVFDTNLRYPAAAIKTVLPDMLDNGRGVIANVISLEGLAFSTAYSATKVGMRSLTASIAAEIGSESGVWLFSFAPGIVDTPLVNDYFYTELAARFGMTMQDVIAGVGGNPGYPGLMPAAHCAAGLVHCIQSARRYHGQVVNPFLPLAKAGVISFDEGLQTRPFTEAAEGEDALPKELASLGDYLKSVTELNRALEHRVDVRTRELTDANEKLQSLLEEVNQLSGLLPICSYCKKIRDDKGYWTQLEKYIDDHSEAQLSHGICEECVKEHYPEFELGGD
jgi:NAD(P)-dependent dehydrogenase (short-subunit alcohol dehydrogenase family)